MISVIIPVMNRRSALRRAAQSAISQSGLESGAIEVIVVDDGSDPAIAADWLPNGCRIVRLDRNAGPAAARNAGIAAARGDILAFLDSDDIWLPEKIALQLALFRSIESAAVSRLNAVVCGFYYFNHRMREFETRIPRSSSDAIDFAGGCWFCPGSTLLVARHVLEATGGFDEGLRRLEDVDWFLRFALKGGAVHVLPTPCAVIRPSGSVGMAALSEPLKRLEAKYLGEGAPALKLNGPMRRTLRAYCELEKCASSLVDRRKVRALGYLARSLLLSPRTQPALRPYWNDSGFRMPDDIRAMAAAGLALDDDGCMHPVQAGAREP